MILVKDMLYIQVLELIHICCDKYHWLHLTINKYDQVFELLLNISDLLLLLFI